MQVYRSFFSDILQEDREEKKKFLLRIPCNNNVRTPRDKNSNEKQKGKQQQQREQIIEKKSSNLFSRTFFLF